MHITVTISVLNFNMSDDQREKIIICDGCLLPASPSWKMLRCGRCKAAVYHNRDCQVKHYPTHKHSCRKGLQNPTNPFGPSNDMKFMCHRSRERGRSLIACRDFQPKERLMDALPICQPVLNEQNRRMRCTFCFCMLPPSSHYRGKLHSHCSKLCRDRDREFEEEEYALKGIKYDRPPPSIVILLARIIRKIFISNENCSKNSVYQSIMGDLVSNYDILDEDCVEKYTVFATSSCRWLSLMGNDSYSTALSELGMEILVKLAAKMDMNCFTVSDGEFVGIGIGLFPAAAVLNHSCKANAVQTCQILSGALPKVSITLCNQVKVHHAFKKGFDFLLRSFHHFNSVFDVCLPLFPLDFSSEWGRNCHQLY